ncbi:MAG: DNA polymerase, partial [Syntrophobacteraceae bacterium]
VEISIGGTLIEADSVSQNRDKPENSHWRYMAHASLFNLPVQTNGADGLKLALIHIPEKLNGLDARIVHTQHDEIIVAAKDGIEDQVLTIVKESMEAALERIIPEVPFIAEIRVAEAKAFSYR